eukprot:scaffold244908_cov25-Tisochrysis_lutea.AAC.1
MLLLSGSAEVVYVCVLSVSWPYGDAGALCLSLLDPCCSACVAPMLVGAAPSGFVPPSDFARFECNSMIWSSMLSMCSLGHAADVVSPSGFANSQCNSMIWSNICLACLPWVMLLMCALQGELGKGAFQELDQVAALRPFCKYAASASRCGVGILKCSPRAPLCSSRGLRCAVLMGGHVLP